MAGNTVTFCRLPLGWLVLITCPIYDRCLVVLSSWFHSKMVYLWIVIIFSIKYAWSMVIGLSTDWDLRIL